MLHCNLRVILNLILTNDEEKHSAGEKKSIISEIKSIMLFVVPMETISSQIQSKPRHPKCSVKLFSISNRLDYVVSDTV